MKERFLSGDLTDIFGIERGFQEHLTREGFFRPSVAQASGKGTRNIYNREDIYLLAVFLELTNRGWSRELASKYVKAIDNDDLKKLITWLGVTSNQETSVFMEFIEKIKEFNPNVDIEHFLSDKTIKNPLRQQLIDFLKLDAEVFLVFTENKEVSSKVLEVDPGQKSIIKCTFFIKNGPKFEDEMELFMDYKDINLVLDVSESAFVLNLRRILFWVDEKIEALSSDKE